MSESSQHKRFAEDVAVVTGSTRGIGERIAKRLAVEGATVVVTGRSHEAGTAVAEDIEDTGNEATFVKADMRSPPEISALFEATVDEYGSLDILVNNAAVQTETSVEETTLKDWDQVLETDFRSYWLCAKQAHRYMDRGTIVNISSNHAFSTMPSHFPYNAVKAGINGMTRAMALDFGPEIRVNTINPGWIYVDRTMAEMAEQRRQELAGIHPVGRIGKPEDIAGVATFLASDDAAFVTGASLRVDGGRGAVMQDDTLPDYRELSE
ncbi:SDR family NAD(P)-dependent oxidoreductase [Halobacterium bonnevillei]|uniref:Glucose 1-dehydrogenase n=1 Tax=Halobacterium bonnevillei TaxID=2692200 RepID=A0A6B0SQE2_9EURY|nr:SDR family oxidoreductase [Halobacterium bonnevillei]MXR21801.1 glucose 1-dehydrogenase [Halobacterium bonnevillei]